ncbi:Acylamino-acid-releasing enzyme [Linum perenne]
MALSTKFVGQQLTLLFRPRPLPLFSLHFPTVPSQLSTLTKLPPSPSIFCRNSLAVGMDGSTADTTKTLPLGLDPTMEDEYDSQSKLLREFASISSIDKAWTFKSQSGIGSQAMFAVSQANLLANKRRKFIMSTSISKGDDDSSVSFQWAPFPVEMTGVAAMLPSPSGSKLLLVKNPENDSPVQFEIWCQSHLEKEFQIPQSVHGSVYTDGWFEGISWNSDETHIAYVAEEAPPTKPKFDNQGYKKCGSTEKDCSSWKGLGEWEEEWGETYAGKRRPVLFVVDVNSGEVQPVKGIAKHLSVGQVVWAPSSTDSSARYLVFVGWSAERRKLGIKYCYNRPCSLYAAIAPLFGSDANSEQKEISLVDSSVINVTQSIGSAFFPLFSPDGKSLVFLSARSCVDSGAHWGTESLHRIDWSNDLKALSSANIVEVIPIVQCPEDGGFPGLYYGGFLRNPWLSDGSTIVLNSVWHSSEVILAVNIISGVLRRISPIDSNAGCRALTLDSDNIIAVSSSPVDLPEIKYGHLSNKEVQTAAWNWLSVPSPMIKCSDKVKSLLSSRQFSILKIPVTDVSANSAKGATKPYEAIYVSCTSKKSDQLDPMIVVLHGGPHSVSLSSFSKNHAFLTSLGYSLLIVNYRGSLGFGEEALQSLPGKVGTQDVNDVLAAIDYAIDKGLANPTKIAVVGGSHGGFLTTHLIGQAPEKFAAAAARNPVCNLASMVGSTDIPDWCYFEVYGSEGKDKFTEATSAADLAIFHSKSPISHISKVKTPTIFLIGAQDLRVPPSNGIQYARALKEKGVQTKMIIFPNDVHGIERPQSDYESFLNIGVWFNKYCK